MANLATWLWVAGLGHLGVLVAAAMVPAKVSLRAEFDRLSPFTRQLAWTHAAYVAMTIAAIGGGSVFLADELASGSPLARAVCGFVSIFWTLRLGLSVWMHPREHLDHLLFKVGYVALLAAFAGFALVYGYAAVAGMEGG